MKEGVIKNIRRMIQYISASILPKEMLQIIYSKAVIGYVPNLKEPKTFNEKLQWYKLYYCSNDSVVSMCADKYEVRKYIKDKGFVEYLNDLYGVWDRVSDIPWDNLPEKFVLKCTHGCAYNIICSDKNKFDRAVAIRKLNNWMKEDFGKYNLEFHYSSIKPRIICEKYLGGNMTDYKFFCFSGKMEFMYISEGLDHDDTATIAFFDSIGEPAKFRRSDYEVNVSATVPDEFQKLSSLSELLANEFPFVRVDWFVVENNIYFSEMTFVPCAGMMPFDPKEYDVILGELFKLPEKKILGRT